VNKDTLPRFKNWRGEYTIVGLLAVALAIAGAVVEFPIKAKGLWQVLFPTAQQFSVTNNRGWQTLFDVVKRKQSNVIEMYDWGGYYDLTNLGDAVVTVTDFRVLWPAVVFNGQSLTLEMLGALGSSLSIDVFDDAASLERFTDGKESSGAHLHETFPLVIPPHSTRHVIIHFILDITYGGKQLVFQREDEAYMWLSRSLALSQNADGTFHCGFKVVPVQAVTSDGKTLSYNPQTTLLLPGCKLTLP
jgi:hypothetical protein